MDIKKAFRGVSQKLQADFQISSGINHHGLKGSFRESALRDFLLAGRLPKRYGIGIGEIIGPNKNVSKQSDLIIYDQLDGMSLLYNDNVQIYPIESIFGVIEVKSRLSKEELIKSLENIKSVKSLAPDEPVTATIHTYIRSTYPRPKPFGIVFAYSLANNSLQSLVENLEEWEAENSNQHWPNLIAILGEGIILHRGTGMKNMSLINNNELSKAIAPSYLAYQSDTLFHFYSTLIDLCSDMQLGSVNLKRYFEPAEQLGPYVVRKHEGIIKNDEDTLYRLTFNFVDKIVQHCKSIGKISNRELLIKQFGAVPPGMEEDRLNFMVYHYDPQGLPGFHEVANPMDFSSGGALATEEMLIPSQWIEVDGEIYNFSQSYVTEDSIEPIPGSSIKDL